MTEFPIIDNIMTNKKYKNLNKSNSFKEKQRSFKRQEKQAKQIAELPIKFQKAIKAAVSTTQEKKPKPYPKVMHHKQKKMPVSVRSIQNILDEEFEGEADAYDMLQEIAIQIYLEKYEEQRRLEEEQIQSVLNEYERLVRAAEKDYQFDYCEELFDLREDFPRNLPEDIFDVCGGWSSDEEKYSFYNM